MKATLENETISLEIARGRAKDITNTLIGYYNNEKFSVNNFVVYDTLLHYIPYKWTVVQIVAQRLNGIA